MKTWASIHPRRQLPPLIRKKDRMPDIGHPAISHYHTAKSRITHCFSKENAIFAAAPRARQPESDQEAAGPVRLRENARVPCEWLTAAGPVRLVAEGGASIV